MVMPCGMTIRPNGQAWIACPLLPAEQESEAGELAVRRQPEGFIFDSITTVSPKRSISEKEAGASRPPFLSI